MEPAAVKTYLDIFVSYGLPLVISGGALVLLWKYIPAWIDASIKTQNQVPIELANLNATLREGARDMHQIKQAVKHGAQASALLMKSQNADPSVRREISNMLKALGDGNGDE